MSINSSRLNNDYENRHSNSDRCEQWVETAAILNSSEIGVALKKQVKNKPAIDTPELVF